MPELAFRGSWKSDYGLPIQGVRFYDFGAGEKALVSKDSEGFAIVDPMVGRLGATSIDTVEEDVDGMVADTAALYDASATPQDSRMYVAHGRVRSAVRLSDFARQYDEDVHFDAVGTVTKERPFALDIDETNELLYTVTAEGALYCEDISDQTAPTQHATPLVFSLFAGEAVVDLKVWAGAGEEVAVILTNQRVITARIVTGVLTLVGQSTRLVGTSPIVDSGGGPMSAPSISDLLVIALFRLVVFKDLDGLLVAAITCEGRGYELAVVTRPFAHFVVMCDLDISNGYAQPHIRKPAPPPVGQTEEEDLPTWHVLYNSFPVEPGGWQALVDADGNDPATGLAYQLKAHYSVADTQLVDTGSALHLYVAQGRRKQVTVLDVSHAFTAGIPVVDTVICHPNFVTDPWTAEDISHLNLDPADPTRMLVMEQFVDGIRAIDTGLATNNLLAGARFNEGGQRDLCVVGLPAKPFVLLSLDFKQVEYMFRVVEMPATTPVLLHEGYWSHTSDGMVAVPPDYLYGCTFGGVVRWSRQGASNQFRPVAASYQPVSATAYQPNWYREGSTEWIDIGRDVLSAGDDRLYTCTPGEGPMEFIIDPGTKNPGPARHLELPTFPHADLPGWTNSGIGTYYSNQVAYVVIDGASFVMCDFVNRITSDYALLVWKLDAGMDTWSFLTAGVISTGLPTYTIKLSDHLTVTEKINGRQFAIIDSWDGFFTFRIDQLQSDGIVTPVEANYTPGIASACHGVAVSKDRLFAVFHLPLATSTTSQIRVYPFDTTTGETDMAAAGQVVNSSETALPAGQRWARIFSTNLRTLNQDSGQGALFLCCDDGTVLEFWVGPTTRRYEREANTVRSHVANMLTDLKAAIPAVGALPEFYDNNGPVHTDGSAPIDVLVSIRWAESERRSTLTPDSDLFRFRGVVRIAFTSPAFFGDGLIRECADYVADAMRHATAFSVMFGTPTVINGNPDIVSNVRFVGRQGHFARTVEVPFTFDQVESRLASSVGESPGLDSIAEICRTRFEDLVADAQGLTVFYDNAPEVIPSNMPWAQVSVMHGDSQLVSFGVPLQRYRSSGLLQVSIFVGAGTGDAPALRLADDVFDAFHNVADRGVLFKTPAVVASGRVGPYWRVLTQVPFTAEMIQ